jgi:hypothetical protein
MVSPSLTQLTLLLSDGLRLCTHPFSPAASFGQTPNITGSIPRRDSTDTTEEGGRLRPDNRFRKTAETRRQRVLRPDQARLQIREVGLSPMVCLSRGIDIGSGLIPSSRRLRQSAAVLNRSSELRRIIFIQRGSPKGHERLTGNRNPAQSGNRSN